jgi:hypothetical protein
MLDHGCGDHQRKYSGYKEYNKTEQRQQNRVGSGTGLLPFLDKSSCSHPRQRGNSPDFPEASFEVVCVG